MGCIPYLIVLFSALMNNKCAISKKNIFEFFISGFSKLAKPAYFDPK